MAGVGRRGGTVLSHHAARLLMGALYTQKGALLLHKSSIAKGEMEGERFSSRAPDAGSQGL